MTRRWLVLPLALLGLAASPYVPWEELTEADWMYAVATRFSEVDGHQVHYPTPTAELASALAARSETIALRHLAEARLALGDRPGAVAAITQWAQATGPEAWAEAARWCAAHSAWEDAFAAARTALPGLRGAPRRALAEDLVKWADAHPELADPLEQRKARAAAFPDDALALEDWIRALEAAGRLDEAATALDASPALSEEVRLLLRSDLFFQHGDRRAYELLDQALGDGEKAVGQAVKQAYAQRIDWGNAGAPEAWRSALDRAYDARALVRLSAYFQGHNRGQAALDLLRQVERRYEPQLERKAQLLVSRLYAEIDAVPEAFRARLGAAQKGSPDEQASDLAALARLALRAGGRALPWGSYNDEPYRWVARLDRTPGFWTGGVSFLLTGQDWKDALARIESESVAERTFATTRLLVDELARRAPGQVELPSLRAALMGRHVERGEGQQALDLLPLVEAGPAEAAQEGRRQALLAMRQVDVPVSEEMRLYRARLRELAADGTLPPALEETSGYGYERSYEARAPDFERRLARRGRSGYRELLDEALSRLEQRDPSHRSSLDLMLSEMDRLPDAEELWSELAGRLEGWNLDDELGPRYERALERFDEPGWWMRAARWYARRSRQRDLRRLAEELAARFRASELFARAHAGELSLEIPEQPPVGARVRLVSWADWVRLEALERFPHSPAVYREALGRLITRRQEQTGPRPSLEKGQHPVIVEASFLLERRYALLFVDAERRAQHLDADMHAGDLEQKLQALEARGDRTPVEDRLLLDGWARLSQFERASAPGDRLAAAYPGDGDLARQVLSLHRSLSGLDASHAAPARAVAERTAPALEDPNPLWTELGELEQERGQAAAARAAWARLVEREPRSSERVNELASVLWDYGYMPEALRAIEEGRRRVGQPGILAFEAGVLREEVRDLDGAVREYLAAARPPGDPGCFCTWYEGDQRALRRLSQLLAREPVRARVLRAIGALRAGSAADERTLVSLLALSQIEMPDDTLDSTSDDWIDLTDMPNDPVGREQREAARADWRPQAREGFVKVGAVLLERALAMAPQASASAFLDKLRDWRERLLDPRWGAERGLDFDDAVLRRSAELAPSEEERVRLEVERAQYLLQHGRREAADAVWAALGARIGGLPQGASRLRAEAARAGYLERSRGVEAAAAEWKALQARYPWSLGVLEDRLAFLGRIGRGDEARAALEQVAPRAAGGHREALLERLAREAIEARDLPQARRATERLLAEAGLAEGQRLGALHLLARLTLREDARGDLLALARTHGPRLPDERQADVYAQLARAARIEKRYDVSATLWIEALNRRLERAWLREAHASAERAGRAGELLGFFERQRERSPRDVRWAVAVRELRLYQHDLEGALEMAKGAAAVRPERESLWREAAELIERAGRPRDAADYLAGWNEPRPADESVAGWRSRLYAGAGDRAQALAVEQAALDACARQGLEPTGEVRERRARAARRLLEYGLPDQALELVAPKGDVKALAASALWTGDQVDLALLTGRFVRLLRQRIGDDDFGSSAAARFSEHARPEQREELHAFVLGRLFPSVRNAGARPWPGDTAELRRHWDFAREAGLEDALRASLARKYLAAKPGPWSADPPADLVAAIGAALVTREKDAWSFRQPEVDAYWLRHLAADQDEAGLGAFLLPRFAELIAKAMGEAPIPKGEAPRDWTRWLDDASVLEAWARFAAARPEGLSDLAPIFKERRRWDRLWALGARQWKVAPIVAALPEDVRTAWFGLWQTPSARDADPLLRTRGESLERAGVALAHLVTGAPGAAADPTIAKLRGPRTVGDVLGAEPAWTWPEFAPRPGVSDDTVVGSGSDAGRHPGALWGQRPGAAWYALETLARWREGDRDAPLVALELPQRGRESEHGALAAGLHESLGDLQAAIALDAERKAPGTDAARLRIQLQRLIRSGAKDSAEAALSAELRRLQRDLSADAFRRLAWLAEDLGLASTLDALDPSVPVSPDLLADLYDRLGSAAGQRFRSTDTVGWRVALASRWIAREPALGAEEVRTWLHELWAPAAANLPERGLVKLGGVWPRASEWLQSLPAEQRAEALAALEALPDMTRLDALLARAAAPRSESARLLRLRVALAAGDDGRATAAFDEMVAELQAEPPLSYEAVAVGDTSDGEDETGEAAEAGEEAPLAPATPSDAVTARLGAWLQPFREAQRLALVAARASAVLSEARQDGHASVAAWRLGLELLPAEERAPILTQLEHSWIRGDWPPDALPALVDALTSLAPAEAGRWMARMPVAYTLASAQLRSRLLTRLKDADGAAAVLIEARQRAPWSLSEEVGAFDAWRRLPIAGRPAAKSAPASVTPPATWSAALPFWTRKPGDALLALGPHLRRHPFDVLAVRAALRSVAPGDPEALRLAQALYASGHLLGSEYADRNVLQARLARSLASRSWRAARQSFAAWDAQRLAAELARRRFPAADVNGAVADLARVAAQAGDRGASESALGALDARGYAEGVKLRAELRGLRPPAIARPFRLEADGRAAPYRPRDVDWPLLAAVLAAEARQ